MSMPTCCPQCGWNVEIDEDCCCVTCGADAVGPGIRAIDKLVKAARGAAIVMHEGKGMTENQRIAQIHLAVALKDFKEDE